MLELLCIIIQNVPHKISFNLICHITMCALRSMFGRRKTLKTRNFFPAFLTLDVSKSGFLEIIIHVNWLNVYLKTFCIIQRYNGINLFHLGHILFLIQFFFKPYPLNFLSQVGHLEFLEIIKNAQNCLRMVPNER
jgi:hypothetical protein